MSRSTFFGRVDVAACACAVLFSIGCSQAPTAVSGTNDTGGTAGGGQGGTNNPGTSAGGASGSDAATTSFIQWDAPPAWWGAADAPQGPEVPPTPTVDSNCGSLTNKATRQPVDVLLVLDRSASMDYSTAADCYCTTGAATYGSVCSDTTNCTTRWNAIKPAVTTTLSSSTYVNWALKFFPSAPASSGFGNSNCNETSTMDVKFASGSTTEADVESQIESKVNSADFALGTPTAAALNAASAYLQTVNDGNDKFILLATDGEPNCGGGNLGTDDVQGASDAAAAAYAAGIKVYVVGIGPNLDNLTKVASSGGTTDFYPVSSPDDLVSALSSISKLVGSCNFTSDKAPDDPNNVAVYVNGQKVAQDPSNGWTYGSSSQEIVLTGDYCAQMSSGNQADVQILFGCKGQVDFPPNIY